MYVKPEITILFFLISFLIYTMPNILVKFSKSYKGKFLLLVLTIVITLYNPIGGMIMAMFFIFLSEFNYEFNNEIIYEGFGSIDDEEDEDKNLRVDLNNNDKLKVETFLRPRDSALTTNV